MLLGKWDRNECFFDMTFDYTFHAVEGVPSHVQLWSMIVQWEYIFVGLIVMVLLLWLFSW